MLGRRPYLGKNRQEIKEAILNKQVLVGKKEIPENWTIESADFINKCLQRRPVKRLGWAGVHELKNHKWLRNFPWDQLKNKEISSPFLAKYNPHEVRYRVTEYETQFRKILNKNKEMLTRGHLQDYFEGYSFSEADAKGDRNCFNLTMSGAKNIKSKEFIISSSSRERELRAEISKRNTISSHGRFHNL